jgi:predicted phosphoribosyltransferase
MHNGGGGAQVFADRAQAGRALAALLEHHRGSGAVVLGLARGGIPVAYEVARALSLTLDVCVVRKLGLPGREELAMGAIARGALVLNPEVVGTGLVDAATLERVAEREAAELVAREQAYRAGRRPVEVAGRRAIVVDDGLATGASMLAAIQALREQGAGPITAGVPVAPPSTCRLVERDADEVVCVSRPRPFGAVGRWYEDFAEVGDAEVERLLKSPDQ